MAPTTLVPPRRLSALLRSARKSSGVELIDLVAHSSWSIVELDDIEAGRRPLDSAELEEILRLYGVEPSRLVPERSRLVIDLDEGRIAVDQADMAVLEPGGVDVHGPDAILARYLALVYRLRGLPVGTALELREVDVDVLATALALDGDEIERRLCRLIDEESVVAADQRRLMRQLLVPVVGVVVGATAVGTLILVAEDDSAPAPDAVTTVVDDAAPRLADAAVEERSVPTDIGVGAAVEENPDAAP